METKRKSSLRTCCRLIRLLRKRSQHMARSMFRLTRQLIEEASTCRFNGMEAQTQSEAPMAATITSLSTQAPSSNNQSIPESLQSTRESTSFTKMKFDETKVVIRTCQWPSFPLKSKRKFNLLPLLARNTPNIGRCALSQIACTPLTPHLP